MNINELALKRLQGWRPNEMIFISTVGKVAALGEVTYLDQADNYAALAGVSVMVICSKRNPAKGYEIADKAIKAKALNVAIWVIEIPKIAELVCYGYQFKTAKPFPASDDLQKIVEGMARVMQ